MSDEEEALRLLKEKIERDRGFNCGFYKDKCLRRRFAVRMRARGEESFAGYTALLDADPGEYERLLDALTINVTKFFRNAEVWATVRDLVIPELFASQERVRRVWSAGCASGEEPYSVSILLQEHAEREGREAELLKFRVLGTDIDRRSLESAARAVYGEMALAETPPATVERWFSPGPRYTLDPRARELVSFEHRDLISGHPEAEQSLILCRNVIIYFDREIQDRIFRRFYDALVPGGFLVLGKVETLLGPVRSLMRPVSTRERIFQKTG